MSLPETDIQYLTERGINHQIAVEAGMTCLVITGYQLPAGYDCATSDLLLRLNPGYPDVQPDMWWFSPAVKLKGGGQVPQTDTVETHLGRVWQRWSRHFNTGHWQPGNDSLESFLAVIKNDILKYPKVAA